MMSCVGVVSTQHVCAGNMANNCTALHNSDGKWISSVERLFIDYNTPDVPVPLIIVSTVTSAATTTNSSHEAVHMHPLCGCGFFMELGTEVKTTKFSSGTSVGIFTKFCTRESFPLIFVDNAKCILNQESYELTNFIGLSH